MLWLRLVLGCPPGAALSRQSRLSSLYIGLYVACMWFICDARLTPGLPPLPFQAAKYADTADAEA